MNAPVWGAGLQLELRPLDYVHDVHDVHGSIDQFIAWYCSEPRLAFNRIVVVRYRMHLETRGLAANTIQQLAAVRRLAHEAADSGLLSPELAAGISRVKRGQATRFPLRQLAERGAKFRSTKTRLWR